MLSSVKSLRQFLVWLFRFFMPKVWRDWDMNPSPPIPKVNALQLGYPSWLVCLKNNGIFIFFFFFLCILKNSFQGSLSGIIRHLISSEMNLFKF